MSQPSKRVRSCPAAPPAVDTQPPVALYKRALRLIKQHRCGHRTDGDAVSALEACIFKLPNRARSATELGSQGFGKPEDYPWLKALGDQVACASAGVPPPAVQHSYDLDLEDEGYLIAAAHLQLGQLLEKQGHLANAQSHLSASLLLFPTYVAALTALSQVLHHLADTWADLQLVEQHLQAAVAAADQLAAVDNGMLVDSNKVCQKEVEAGDVARSRLALLLLQAGRVQQAEPLLIHLGFRFRLADEVLQYPMSCLPKPMDPLAQSSASGSQSTASPTAKLNGQNGTEDATAACIHTGPAEGGGSEARLEAGSGAAAAVPEDGQLEPLDQLQLLAQVADTNGGDLPGSSSNSQSTCSSSRYIRVVDNALPPDLLAHLQRGFAPEAAFWQEHNYGRVGYFSYIWPLDAPVTSSLQQLASHLHSIALPYFPGLAEAKYAELWAHCRRHDSGHQLHFDSDDEGIGGVRNPIISTVVYLQADTPSSSMSSEQSYPANGNSASAAAEAAGAAGNTRDSPGVAGEVGPAAGQGLSVFVGGPTLMTDQLLGGTLARRGWLACPATNRLTMFDARYLHGVLPGCGPSPDVNGRRITVMVAFWKEVKCRPLVNGQPGPTMPLPQQAASSCWTQDFWPKASGWGSCSTTPVNPIPVAKVWEPILKGGKPMGPPTYDHCFQGF